MKDYHHTYRYLGLFLLAFNLVLPSFSQEIAFENISTEEGLSHNSVNAILQDSYGFMWFGTINGLNRYSGHSLEIIKKNTQPVSISGSDVRVLAEDHAGNLWIGTQDGGLTRLHLATNQTTHFRVESATHPISDNSVWSLLTDSKGRVWMGTYNGILHRYQPEKDRFEQIPIGVDGETAGALNCLAEDSFGRIWVGSHKGYISMLKEDGNFMHLPISEREAAFPVRSLTNHPDGYLLIGSEGNGVMKVTFDENQTPSISTLEEGHPLNAPDRKVIIGVRSGPEKKWWVSLENGLAIYDPYKGEFQHINSQQGVKNSIGKSPIRTVYFSKEGIVWVPTSEDGVYKHAPSKAFKTISHKKDNPNSLTVDLIRSLYADEDHLWVGYLLFGGLTKYNLQNDTFTHFFHDPKNPNSLSFNNIHHLAKASNGKIWIATFNGGLELFDPVTNTFRHFRHNPNNPNSISDNRVQSVIEDLDGNVWVGTESGLNFFEPRKDKWSHFRHVPGKANSLSDDRIQSNAMAFDQEGNLWVGTWGGGLNKIEYRRKEIPIISHWAPGEKETHGLTNAHIISLHFDSKGRLWAGSYGGGVFMFDPRKETFTNYSETDGLSSDIVYAIEEDEDKNLWFATIDGLTRFNPKDKSFRRFDVFDGLPTNEFFWGSSENIGGELFFGTVNGIVRFRPKDVNQPSPPPQVLINKLLKFDEPIQLEKATFLTKKLELDHSDNFFAIEFSAMDFSASSKVQYAYMLEGHDQQWIQYGNNHYVHYTNLPGGNYTFKVKAANSEGIWNETPTTLEIYIQPPFHQTWWFKSAIGLLVLGLIYGAYRVRILQIQKTNTLLEQEVKNRTKELEEAYQELTTKNEELTALDDEKNHLISIVAHDLRSPLSQIIGMASIMKLTETNLGEEGKRCLQSITESSERLRSMISRVLDTQTLETKEIVLKPTEVEIMEVLKEVVETNQVAAKKKDILLETSFFSAEIHAFIDLDFFLQVVDNLLSNAIKFSPKCEKVELLVHKESDSFMVCVKDSGPGINEEDQKKLFRKFQRLSAKPTAGEESMGLGLSIVKKYVDAMKGKIWVESSLGKGATFCVRFPL